MKSVTFVAMFGTVGVATALAVVIAPEADAGYGSCDEARAAGAAPLYAGQPGYSRKLDRDGDGVACEQGGSGGGYLPAAPFVGAPDTEVSRPPAAPPSTVSLSPASAATPSETCDDWGKLRPGSDGGVEQVCGAISSPATIWYWIPAGDMPGGLHDAGSTCPDVPLFTFARTPDDYQVWCAEGISVDLPGGRSVSNPLVPIWGLYSP